MPSTAAAGRPHRSPAERAQSDRPPTQTRCHVPCGIPQERGQVLQPTPPSSGALVEPNTHSRDTRWHQSAGQQKADAPLLAPAYATSTGEPPAPPRYPDHQNEPDQPGPEARHRPGFSCLPGLRLALRSSREPAVPTRSSSAATRRRLAPGGGLPPAHGRTRSNSHLREHPSSRRKAGRHPPRQDGEEQQHSDRRACRRERRQVRRRAQSSKSHLPDRPQFLRGRTRPGPRTHRGQSPATALPRPITPAQSLQGATSRNRCAPRRDSFVGPP